MSNLNNLTKLHEPYLHEAETNWIGSSSCPCPWQIGFEQKKKIYIYIYIHSNQAGEMQLSGIYYYTLSLAGEATIGIEGYVVFC